MRALLIVVAMAGTAAAGPFAGEDLFRPPIEWSTYVRGAYGAQSESETGGRHARIETTREHSTWDLALGVEASLALSIGGDVRLGAWAETRGFDRDDQFAGGELVITRVPKRLDMFLYEGHGILALRGGRSASAATASIAYGYLAPWKLEGECRVRFFAVETGVCAPRPRATTRYMIGVRLVATATRSIDDPRAWSATLGVEFEPAGALRATGIRSWY